MKTKVKKLPEVLYVRWEGNEGDECIIAYDSLNDVADPYETVKITRYEKKDAVEVTCNIDVEESK